MDHTSHGWDHPSSEKKDIVHMVIVLPINKYFKIRYFMKNKIKCNYLEALQELCNVLLTQLCCGAHDQMLHSQNLWGEHLFSWLFWHHDSTQTKKINNNTITWVKYVIITVLLFCYYLFGVCNIKIWVNKQDIFRLEISVSQLIIMEELDRITELIWHVPYLF